MSDSEWQGEGCVNKGCGKRRPCHHIPEPYADSLVWQRDKRAGARKRVVKKSVFTHPSPGA